MTMNTTTIKVALVGHDHTIEVNPNDHDDHIMRATIEISKAGAILIRRYARKCRAPAAGKTAPTDLSRDEFYEYIRDSMPKLPPSSAIHMLRRPSLLIAVMTWITCLTP